MSMRTGLSHLREPRALSCIQVSIGRVSAHESSQALRTNKCPVTYATSQDGLSGCGCFNCALYGAEDKAADTYGQGKSSHLTARRRKGQRTNFAVSLRVGQRSRVSKDARMCCKSMVRGDSGPRSETERQYVWLCAGCENEACVPASVICHAMPDRVIQLGAFGTKTHAHTYVCMYVCMFACMYVPYV
jgi:hypothetical protein